MAFMDREAPGTAVVSSALCKSTSSLLKLLELVSSTVLKERGFSRAVECPKRNGP
jgi:hypothetical protein